MYFINVGNLLTGDTLISVNGEDLLVSSCYIEECNSPTTVYNFQVEDYHTYFVGENRVWVHNAEYTPVAYNSAGSKSVREVNSVDMYENAHSMPMESKPNSVAQNYCDGNLTTERYFGNNGKPYLDIDYTNHGNSKMHPNVPHEHSITFIDNIFKREKTGRVINQ